MLFEIYNNKIKNNLKEKFSYKSIMEIPKLSKVTINVGLGVIERGAIDNIINDVMLISGQKPVIVMARKSISNFKLREGVPIGVMVTLRRLRMYHFLERLLYVALPRSRDFRGMKRDSFDGAGNYSFGIKEHIVFPEIEYGSGRVYGMDVSLTTTAKTDSECYELLSGFGFPFMEKNR